MWPWPQALNLLGPWLSPLQNGRLGLDCVTSHVTGWPTAFLAMASTRELGKPGSQDLAQCGVLVLFYCGWFLYSCGRTGLLWLVLPRKTKFSLLFLKPAAASFRPGQILHVFGPPTRGVFTSWLTDDGFCTILTLFCLSVKDRIAIYIWPADVKDGHLVCFFSLTKLSLAFSSHP